MLLTRLPSDQFGLDRDISDLPPPVLARYSRMDLHGWIATIACLDIVGAVAISLVIFGVYAEPLNYDPAQLWAGLGGFVVAWFLASQSQHLYQHKMVLAGKRMLVRAAATCALAFGLILLMAFGFRLIGEVSRLWLFAWAAGALGWVIATRLVWRQHMQAALRAGRCLDRALVVAGSEAAARRVGAALERESLGRIRVAASVALPGVAGGPSLGWIEGAVRDGAVDRVLIADFENAKDETNALLTRLMRLAVDVTLMPNFQGLYMPFLCVDRIGYIPAVEVAVRPLTAGQALCKRLEDLAVASAALLALLPVLPLLALAIKLDSPGPVFFRQKRVGFHDSTFRLWKFRTMRHDMRDDGAATQTSRGDPRVTRVGRLLRRTSLDELPQLFNVLCGEMSIVGPRPHALQMTTAGLPMNETMEEYASRHRIKPGITGWAQVNGCRGEVQSEAKLRERIRLDCYYIENWSLALDAWIMLRTLLMLAFDLDAY